MKPLFSKKTNGQRREKPGFLRDSPSKVLCQNPPHPGAWGVDKNDKMRCKSDTKQD